MRALASCVSPALHRSFTSWPNLTEFQKSQNWGLRHGGTSRIFLSCAKAQPSAAMQSLGCRLMAGQRILVPSMGVRLPPSQPLHLLHMARSSSGLGRRPLKAESRVRFSLGSPQKKTVPCGAVFFIFLFAAILFAFHRKKEPFPSFLRT